MAKFLDINIDATRLDDVVRSLGQLDPDSIIRLSVKSVNKVAGDVHQRAIDKVVDDINVPLQRVQQDLKLTLAAEGQKLPTAKVASPMRNLTLGRFDAGQHSKPVTWSNARIEGMGKKFSKWPGWTRRTGDASRGIAPDYKASGIDVTVKRGQTKDMKSAFLLPLRNGGGRMGVFIWAGGAKPKHLYGPAVYQLYRNYINDNEEQIQEELTDEFLVNLDVQLNKVIA